MKLEIRQTIGIFVLMLFVAGCSAAIIKEKTAPAAIQAPTNATSIPGEDDVHRERVLPATQESKRVVPVPDDIPTPAVPDDTTYDRVGIDNTGLSVDIPTGWVHLNPGWRWTPAAGSEMYVGINWTQLEPAKEVESALLPGPSQTLDSEAVTLNWGSGRHFLIEVYGEAARGADENAPVEAIELHVLVVVHQEHARRGFDLYASAPTVEDLDALNPVLQHMLDTSILAE
jgi:hypothetical protein